MTRLELLTAVFLAETLAQDAADERWKLDALCREYPELNWFPNRKAKSVEERRVCRACAVQVECLDYALRWHRTVGIWGGTSERQRAQLRAVRS
jgi:WhiB family redox-sensing transcriptional regulator